jgi:hypothetical protein
VVAQIVKLAPHHQQQQQQQQPRTSSRTLESGGAGFGVTEIKPSAPRSGSVGSFFQPTSKSKFEPTPAARLDLDGSTTTIADASGGREPTVRRVALVTMHLAPGKMGAAARLEQMGLIVRATLLLVISPQAAVVAMRRLQFCVCCRLRPETSGGALSSHTLHWGERLTMIGPLRMR